MKQFLLALSCLLTCTTVSLAATTPFGKLMPLLQTAIDNEVYGNSGKVRLVHTAETVNLRTLSLMLLDEKQTSFSLGYEIDLVRTFERLFPRADDTDMSCETNESVIDELTRIAPKVKLMIIAGAWTSTAGAWNVIVLVDSSNNEVLIFSEGRAE
jgi:hypothetical protein